MTRTSLPHLVVVGAGAFGGWTALSLVRQGARVTLIDAWGAGNSRSSSGDETRLIRAMYNGDALYTDLAARALTLWWEADAEWGQTVLRRTGVLYLFESDDGFARRSLPVMNSKGLEVESLTLSQAARRFPQFRLDGVRAAYFEPDAGVLLARRSCELVRATLEREGGTYRQAHVQRVSIKSDGLANITLANGEVLGADGFVFACGSWLGGLFPEAVGDGIIATRQAVLYFGTPAGDSRFDWASSPSWMNFGRHWWYGMPGNERRGFKVADDTAGPRVDPTRLERVATRQDVRSARAFIKRRFPALAAQPLLEARVCQYEYSPAGDFLIDRHPDARNVWLLGGGSGHGFKMGPALGEYVTRLVLSDARPDVRFSYASFLSARDRVRRTRKRGRHS